MKDISISDPLEDMSLAQEVHVDPTLAYYLTIYTPRFIIDHYRLFSNDRRADELEALFLFAAERKRARLAVQEQYRYGR